MKICKIVDFAVPADHWKKLKEREKRDKYLDLAWELKKKLWNMKVTIIPIVIGAFTSVTKGLLKGLEDLEVGDRVETIQTTALLKTARILRRVLETWGDFLSLYIQWNTISLRWCEKLCWVNNNNDNYGNNNRSSNLGQTIRPSDSQQKTENLPNCWLCHPGRPQIKIERSQKEW